MTYKEFKLLKIKIPAGWRQVRMGEMFGRCFKVIRARFDNTKWEIYENYPHTDRLTNDLKEHNFYIKPK